MRYTLFVLLLLTCLLAHSQDVVLKGVVKSNLGEPCSFTSVSTKHFGTGSMQGTVCDENGNFSIKLKPGKNELNFHLIGYQNLDTILQINAGSHFTREFTMQADPTMGNDVMVFADRKDIAREVMKKAIDQRSIHLGRGKTYRYTAYTKNSSYQTLPDTAEAGKDSIYLALKKRDRPLISEQYNLTETISNFRFAPPNQCHEEVTGTKNYSPHGTYEDHSVTISVEYGEQDITSAQQRNDNNYILRSNTGYNEFNLYNRLLNIPSVTEKKILSPIGESAMLSYTFDLESIYTKDTTRIYIIAINPIFKGEPLFNGKVHIRSSDWALIESDVSLNSDAMYFCESFHIQQHYIDGPNQQMLVQDENIDYVIRDGRNNVYSAININRFDFEEDSSDEKFTDEAQHFLDEAFDRDSLYWTNSRTQKLNEMEQGYAHRCDSLQKHFTSDTYLHEKDSIYNQTKFLDYILFGVGYRNRSKDYEFFINPLIMQINPVGIGGYRHRFGGSFQKEFPNNYLLETDGTIDYGFHNKDVKGKIGVGLTYIPKKFVRTFIRVGDFYDMINTYASLGSVFSRSNYVRTQTVSIAQRMEIINGLFAELTFDYSDQKPINNLKSDLWSQRVFGEINTPINFDRYTKSEIRLDMKYKIAQKYVIKKNKKIILGSTAPEISFTYRKGIHGLFQSQVDFDYLELGARQEKELGRLGNMEWSVLAGSFVNKTNLRILEYRYFRGSDIFFFSDPMKSFQLLGPTLSTANTFLRGNYFHHFNGLVLNKIPLLRKLKLTEAIGAAFLSIPSQDFHHAEFYVGLERAFRIREELFRMGVYGCTADSSWNKPRLEFKIGLNFFDSFHKKWQY